MAVSSVQHRRLLQELKRYRDEAGYTQEEAAFELDWSRSKQFKLESGALPVKVSDVRAMCALYGVSGGRLEVLLVLARRAREQGWWHSYGDAIPTWFEVYLGLETDASRIDTYQSELIHGLLQTPAYYHRLLEISGTVDPADIERKIELRRQRQARLDGDNALHLSVILNQAVLLRSPGDPTVMREQLQYVIDRSGLPNVTVRVLPFAIGLHAAHYGAFEILGFPDADDTDVVYLEDLTSALYLEQNAQVDQYNDIYTQLCGKALDPDKSRELIAQTIQEVR